MKVNVYQTVEVNDEQRVMLGALIDGVTKPKRQATRDEIKEFVWENGANWEVELTDLWTTRFEESADNDVEAEERAARAAELAARVEAATDEDEDLDEEDLI